MKEQNVIIALYIAKTTGGNLQQLAKRKQQIASWKELILQLGQTTPLPEDPVLNSLATGHPEEKIAENITETILTSFFKIDNQVVNNLRKKNVSDKEITLLLLLASQIGTPAEHLADLRQKSNTSLSEMAFNFGFQPGDMQSLITKSTPQKNDSD